MVGGSLHESPPPFEMPPHPMLAAYRFLLPATAGMLSAVRGCGFLLGLTGYLTRVFLLKKTSRRWQIVVASMNVILVLVYAIGVGRLLYQGDTPAPAIWSGSTPVPGMGTLWSEALPAGIAVMLMGVANVALVLCKPLTRRDGDADKEAGTGPGEKPTLSS